MLITNHVMQGAAIGAVAPGPVSAFGLGVASHFTADRLPHWGGVDIEDVMHVAVTDGLVGLSAMATIVSRTPPGHRTRVLAGMLGACFPDSDKPSRLFFGRSPFPRVVDDFHARIQREKMSRMPQEVVVATAGAVVVGALLRRLR